MSNKSEGSAFEREFADLLANEGFWVQLFVPSKDGQPADLIAIKGNKQYLIDCKDCKRDRFALSRIEYNQELAMTRYHNCGNSNALFALKLSNGLIYLISFADLMHLRLHRASIGVAEMEKYGMTFGKWLERREYGLSSI